MANGSIHPIHIAVFEGITLHLVPEYSESLASMSAFPCTLSIRFEQGHIVSRQRAALLKCMWKTFANVLIHKHYVPQNLCVYINCTIPRVCGWGGVGMCVAAAVCA